MGKYVIDNDTLIAIGNAIRTVEETTDSIPVVDIPDRILALEKPGAAQVILTGDLSYAFSPKSWNDEKLVLFKTKDITNAECLFLDNNAVYNIPFELNFDSNLEYVSIKSIFDNCSKVEKLPKVNNCKPNKLTRLFYNCCYLTSEEITQFFNSLDYSYITNNIQSNDDMSLLFYNCLSLRSAPTDVYYYGYPKDISTVSDSIFYRGFYNCCSLDEILNLRVCHEKSWHVNAFQDTFYNCYRLKNLTFATQADGTPYVADWTSQTIDLTQYVGSAYRYTNGTVGNPSVINYNSGITNEKLVINSDTYQALKNDPDWYTTSAGYSRYNHDSAVATINTLPDTSAAIEAAGNSAFKSNTIKFDDYAGTYTDGGAIGSLTEEEVAVAAARGWTVALV